MNQLQIGIDAQLVWALRRLANGTVIGICDPLGLTLEADNDAELHSLVHETLHYLFLDLLEDGLLEPFLRDRGWATHGPLPSMIPPEASVRFDVPVRFEPAHAS